MPLAFGEDKRSRAPLCRRDNLSMPMRFLPKYAKKYHRKWAKEKAEA